MNHSKKFIVTVVAAAMVLMAAAFIIDWRFWYRWHTLPEDAGEWPASYYQPVYEVLGDQQPFFPATVDGESSIRLGRGS
jgi:hypothetical protein